MATKKSSCKITDLNGDCMRRVLFYLRLIDKFKFALACNHFDDIFASFLRKEVFIMREFIQLFRFNEVQAILDRFGPYINRISLRETIGHHNIEYYKLIPKYCRNLDTIELQRNLKPNIDELDMYKEILSGPNKLQCIQVFQNRKLHREQLSERDLIFYLCGGQALCRFISELTQLRTLHYSDSFLPGTGLSSLTNLTDLNIAHCNNFSTNDFKEICHAVKLQSLNINNCFKLDNSALETLVETQTELRQITISNNLLAHNYEVIGRLPSLRELVLIDKNSKKLCELMEELADCHQGDLESLRISSNCILFSTEFRQNILSFYNLKIYSPSSVVAPDDDYLKDIGRKFPQLEKLKLFVSSISSCQGFVNMIRPLRNLTELVLDYSQREEEKFDLKFLRCIIEVRREMNAGLLVLHLLQGTIANDVFRSRDYRNNMDIVIVRRHKPKFFHRI